MWHPKVNYPIFSVAINGVTSAKSSPKTQKYTNILFSFLSLSLTPILVWNNLFNVETGFQTSCDVTNPAHVTLPRQPYVGNPSGVKLSTYFIHF